MIKTKEEYKKLIEDKLKNNIIPGKKIWAVMFFETEMSLGISSTPNKWVNIGNAFFNNGTAALNTYANTPNPASQIIDGIDIEDLANKMEEMNNNYNNINWLNENLYPYL